MTKVTATVFKTNVATAAAALTTALQDDTLTELAEDFKNPHTALRSIENLFLLNAATGVVSANDDYVDAAYAGKYPTSGIDSGRQSAGPRAALTLVSATVENAAPSEIVLTFSANVSDRQENYITLGGAGSAGKTIKGKTINATTATVKVSPDYANGDVITVSGRIYATSGVYVDLVDAVVTNNII